MAYFHSSSLHTLKYAKIVIWQYNVIMGLNLEKRNHFEY